MKKIIAFFILGTLLLTFGGCSKSNLDIALSNLAEVRYNVFDAQSENVNATFMSGKRENPYLIDGICNKSVEFGLLTINFKNNAQPASATYVLKINEHEYSGNLEYNRYESNYMVDVQKIVSNDDNITCKITFDNATEDLSFACKTKSYPVTWHTALQTAVHEFKDDLNKHTTNSKLKGEIHVKIITDLQSNFKDYFWFISITFTDGTTKSIILNPTTCEILAKK